MWKSWLVGVALWVSPYPEWSTKVPSEILCWAAIQFNPGKRMLQPPASQWIGRPDFLLFCVLFVRLFECRLDMDDKTINLILVRRGALWLSYLAT